MRNEFLDRINKKKYINARFLKMNPNQKIVIQSNNSSSGTQGSGSASTYKSFKDPNTLHKDQIKQIERDEKKASSKSIPEIFVCMMGETGANSLSFFSVQDFNLIKTIELSQESCTHFSTHSRSHHSICMATASGSLFNWSTRQAKIMQTLAPFFTEIDENIEYVEKEDEFELEGGVKKNKTKMPQFATSYESSWQALTSRQKELAQTEIDIWEEKPVQEQKSSEAIEYETEELKYLPSIISDTDSYAALSTANVEYFRQKFREQWATT